MGILHLQENDFWNCIVDQRLLLTELIAYGFSPTEVDRMQSVFLKIVSSPIKHTPVELPWGITLQYLLKICLVF